MSARWATTGVFFVNGAVIGTWVAQIPWIRDRFDLTSGQVGLILVGMAAGGDRRAADRRPGGGQARLASG